MPNIDLSILNQRQTPAFYADILANRPAAGFIGRIFVSTNTFEFYRDNGTGWDLIGGPGAGTITGSGAAGQITYWNGASTVTGDNGLFYDAVNDRLGIGTITPGASIDAHSTQSTILQLNQTAINDTRIAFQLSGSALWRLGNFYNGGANDFELFDVIGAQATLTVKKTTGQVLIGTSTVGSGKLVVASATGDNGIQVVGATAPSLRIDNAASGPTKRAGLGIATALNNFIQGAVDRDFCIFNGSTTAASPILFGVYDTGLTNVQEAARISAARNFLIGTSVDAGFKFDVNGTARLQGAMSSIIGASTSNTYLYNIDITQTNSIVTPTMGLNITGTYSDINTGNNTAYNPFLNINPTINFNGSTLNGAGRSSMNLSPVYFCTSVRDINNGVTVLNISPAFTARNVNNITGILYSPTFTLSGANNNHRAIHTVTGNVLLGSTSGNILLGTTTDAGFKLDVNGTSRVSGNVQINSGQLAVNGPSANGSTTIIAPVNSGFNNFIQIDQPNSRIYIQRGNVDGGAVIRRPVDNDGEFAFLSSTNNVSLGYYTFSNTGGRLVTFANSGSLLLGTISDLASSILTINSTTRGFLPPRMTTAQKNLIGTPATGLVVYDTTLNKLSLYTGATWETVTSV